MSQQIQTVENRVPLSDPQPVVPTHLLASFRCLKTPLRMLAGLLVIPLLLIVAALGFVIVLTDFAFFRLRDVRAGHPQPKALWEF